MNLSRLLLLHAVVTLAAGVVLVVAPALIPRTVGVQVSPGAYLICYLLGAAEISLSFLSFGGWQLRDAPAQRLLAQTFIVFHLATAAAEVVAFAQGVDARIWGNIALRLLISLLFFCYGVRQMPPPVGPSITSFLLFLCPFS